MEKNDRVLDAPTSDEVRAAATVIARAFVKRYAERMPKDGGEHIQKLLGACFDTVIDVLTDLGTEADMAFLVLSADDDRTEGIFGPCGQDDALVLYAAAERYARTNVDEILGRVPPGTPCDLRDIVGRLAAAVNVSVDKTDATR